MVDLDINNNLIGWIYLFLTEKLVELVIDRFTNAKQKVITKIPQGLLIS